MNTRTLAKLIRTFLLSLNIPAIAAESMTQAAITEYERYLAGRS